MFTIVRVKNTGEVNYLNITSKQEALNAYYFTTFFAEDEKNSFVGLFHEAKMLMNNKQPKEKKGTRWQELEARERERVDPQIK